MRKVNDFLEGGGWRASMNRANWPPETSNYQNGLQTNYIKSKLSPTSCFVCQVPTLSHVQWDFNTNCLCTIKTLWWCWNFSKKKLLLYVKGKYLFFEYRIAGCSVRAGYPGIRSMRLGDNFNWLEISLNSTNQ